MISRRRFLLSALVTTAAVAVAACGSAAPTPTSATSTPAGAAAPANTPAPTTAPANTPAPTTAPAAQSSPAGGDPVLFGVSGPFTGNNAEYGRIWKNGMAMALDEINGKGGIKGRKVDLVYEDTQSLPQQSVPVAQKFVDDKRLLAELGDFASPASMAASPIYQKAKMVQFGFTNSHPDFTKGGDYMFSIVLTQSQDAAFLAETGVSKLGKKQAVLYRDTDWGKVTNDIYVKRLGELGGSVVYADKFLETEKDFKAMLAKVRDAKPEVLALIAYYNDGALILQQAQSVGLNAKVIANGACYSPQFIKLGGDAVNNAMMTTVFFPDNPRPEVKTFVDAYTKRFNESPDQFAALSYDAVKIISWATDKAGFDRSAIRDTMATASEIPSVIFGPFKFGVDRRVENAKAVPIQVKDGKFVAVT
jgi:branched-chain amino acid transport system substrate-binding protein